MASLSKMLEETRAGMRTLLQGLAGATPVAWEGVHYAPVTGTAFITESMRPVNTIVAGVGNGPLQEHRVNVSWTVAAPAGRGPKQIEALIGTLAAGAPIGARVTYGSTSAIIVGIQIGAIIIQPDWMRQSITFTLKLYT